MGKIIGRIEYYYYTSMFLNMIISGAILWISLFLWVFMKNVVLNIVVLLAAFTLVFFYICITGSSFLFINKISNDKICDFIETTNYSRFYTIITFTLYNSLLLEIFLKTYRSQINNKSFWVFTYLPVLNLLIYFKLINRYIKINPNYSFSKLFSLYMQGRLILLFIKEAKRIRY